MNKRIRKKLKKRGSVFHYCDVGKFIILHCDLAQNSDFTGEFRIPVSQLFNNYGPNKNGVVYTPEVVEKAFKDFAKQHNDGFYIPLQTELPELSINERK